MDGQKRKVSLWTVPPPLLVIAAFLAIVMGVSIDDVHLLFVLILIGQGWLFWGRVPVRLFRRRMKQVLPFLIFSLLFFPLYEPGEPVWALGPFALSGAGMEKALMYSLRLLFTVQTLTLLFYRLPVPHFLQALAALKVPAIFIELIRFTLRFMDVFRQEAERMLAGLKCRGYVGGKWFSLRDYRILAKLLGSLLLRSFRRAERVYLGMLSRGYTGTLPDREEAVIRRTDLAKMLLWQMPVLALLIWDKI